MTDELNGTEIVPHMSVREAVALYRQATQEIADAFAQIVRAEQKLSAFGDYLHVSASRHGHCPNFEHPAETLAYIEKRVWSAIIDRMGIRQVMSIAATQKLDKQLESGDMPPLNEDTVLGMLRGMHTKLPDLAEEAIREVWEWLRPPEDSWLAKEYKSNPRFELGDCVKLTGCTRLAWKTYEAEYYHRPHLDALERVFRVLDGKGPAQKNYHSDIVAAINATPYGSGAVCETSYFRIKLFKKKSIHIFFKRPDLVAEFNRICGGMNLRGERAA